MLSYLLCCLYWPPMLKSWQNFDDVVHIFLFISFLFFKIKFCIFFLFQRSKTTMTIAHTYIRIKYLYQVYFIMDKFSMSTQVFTHIERMYAKSFRASQKFVYISSFNNNQTCMEICMIGMMRGKGGEGVESRPSQMKINRKKVITFESQENTIYIPRHTIYIQYVYGDAVHVTGDLHVTFQSKNHSFASDRICSNFIFCFAYHTAQKCWSN